MNQGDGADAQAKIAEAFRPKILAIRNYSHRAGKQEFFVDDLIDLDTLVDLLWEVDTLESDLTPAGAAFLRHYYGLEPLAKTLEVKEPGFKEHHKDILAWLREITPLEGRRFIGEARGEISPGASPREHLMPPNEYA